MGYERANIARLAPYVPGHQPQAAEVVKLNTNENPYPPPGAVLEAVAAVSADQLRRYPPPRAQRFREVAAKVHGLMPEQVIATNGGDELLRMAITAFCETPGCTGGTAGGVGETDPTYSLYDVLASIHDTPVAKVELGADWSIPDDFAARLNAAGSRLAIVVNPHAPSGRLEPLERLEAVAREFRGVLLIDEAYVNFAERDAVGLLAGEGAAKNVLILRTLSKGYSLAGLRFGYGLGHPDLIAALDKVRDSYNTDVLAQAAATAALEHRDEARQTWRQVIQDRETLRAELERRGLSVAPSQTNFLLAGISGGAERARAVYRALCERHIYVRYFDMPRLDDKLRITVGTPEQNRKLLAALDELL